MNRHTWAAALVLTVSVGAWGIGAELGCPSFLERVGPVGGWCPYGAGPLSWWNSHCFPRCGGPDDYCRKNLPTVCWPPYPPCYIWGPAAPVAPEMQPPGPAVRVEPSGGDGEKRP
jgi:hypothetical protein